MNIQSIKQQIAAKTGASLPTLLMSQQVDKESGELQPWATHWDNDQRVRVTMHIDLFNDLKKDPTQEGLAFKEQKIEAKGDRAAYTRFVVIKPTNVLGTF
jgi:hypothetical protein